MWHHQGVPWHHNTSHHARRSYSPASTDAQLFLRMLLFHPRLPFAVPGTLTPIRRLLHSSVRLKRAPWGKLRALLRLEFCCMLFIKRIVSCVFAEKISIPPIMLTMPMPDFNLVFVNTEELLEGVCAK